MIAALATTAQTPYDVYVSGPEEGSTTATDQALAVLLLWAEHRRFESHLVLDTRTGRVLYSLPKRVREVVELLDGDEVAAEMLMAGAAAILDVPRYIVTPPPKWTIAARSLRVRLAAFAAQWLAGSGFRNTWLRAALVSSMGEASLVDYMARAAMGVLTSWPEWNVTHALRLRVNVGVAVVAAMQALHSLLHRDFLLSTSDAATALSMASVCGVLVKTYGPRTGVADAVRCVVDVLLLAGKEPPSPDEADAARGLPDDAPLTARAFATPNLRRVGLQTAGSLLAALLVVPDHGTGENKAAKEALMQLPVAQLRGTFRLLEAQANVVRADPAAVFVPCTPPSFRDPEGEPAPWPCMVARALVGDDDVLISAWFAAYPEEKERLTAIASVAPPPLVGGMPKREWIPGPRLPLAMAVEVVVPVAGANTASSSATTSANGASASPSTNANNGAATAATTATTTTSTTTTTTTSSTSSKSRAPPRSNEPMDENTGAVATVGDVTSTKDAGGRETKVVQLVPPLSTTLMLSAVVPYARSAPTTTLTRKRPRERLFGEANVSTLDKRILLASRGLVNLAWSDGVPGLELKRPADIHPPASYVQGTPPIVQPYADLLLKVAKTNMGSELPSHPAELLCEAPPNAWSSTPELVATASVRAVLGALDVAGANWETRDKNVAAVLEAVAATFVTGMRGAAMLEGRGPTRAAVATSHTAATPIIEMPAIALAPSTTSSLYLKWADRPAYASARNAPAVRMHVSPHQEPHPTHQPPPQPQPQTQPQPPTRPNANANANAHANTAMARFNARMGFPPTSASTHAALSRAIRAAQRGSSEVFGGAPSSSSSTSSSTSSTS